MSSGTFSLDVTDTIVALASPPGGAIRGIVRASGPDAVAAVRSLIAGQTAAWPASRLPFRIQCQIRPNDWTCDVPADLRIWPGQRSYTGQPIAEIHLPGIPPLLESVLATLTARGVRLARPGEFTLRAFLAGRIDLVRAEGVLGVIDAVDSRQLQKSLDQLAGGISRSFHAVRTDLMNVLADLEAGLDFVDEDISFIGRAELLHRVKSARLFVDEMRSQSESQQQSGTARRVVLAGLPNAGKSTLYNRLIGEDAAIVSSQRGTTRDVLKADVEWNELRITLIDTAGRDELDGAGSIMSLALTMGEAEAEQADLVLWCHAADSGPVPSDWEDLQRELIPGQRRLDLNTKCDSLNKEFDRNDVREALSVSSRTGHGIEELKRAIVGRLTNEQSPNQGWLGMTAARCRESLDLAGRSLRLLEEVIPNESIGDELLAIELRQAINAIGLIVGAVYTDDLLDRVFSRFCIGK